MKYGLIVLLGALAGCQSGMLETVRQVTYPPDYHYLSTQELHSAMHQLDWYNSLLLRTLGARVEPNAEERETVIRVLYSMQGLASELATTEWHSNHPLVAFGMNDFRADLQLAEQAVQQQPADYTLARSIPAYCVECHNQR